MTQEQLARESGLSVRAISNLERGRTTRPHPRSLEVLASALGLPESDGSAWAARLRADQARSASSQAPPEEPQSRPQPLPAATDPGLLDDGQPGHPEAGGKAAQQAAEAPQAAHRRTVRRLRARLVALSLILALAAAALTASKPPGAGPPTRGQGRTAGSVATGAPARSPRPPTLLGIFVSGEDNGDYSTIAGQRPNIANYYLGWGDSFPVDFADQAQSAGATVFVEIEPWQEVWAGQRGECSYTANFPAMTAIGANGSEIKSYLEAFGSEIASFGHPVILTFAREFNHSGQYPWAQGDCEGTTPEQWIKAWKVVRSDIDATARGLARFMWAPSPDDGGTSIDPSPYWPGSSQVDMVGVEGFPDKRWGYQLGTFSGLFGKVFNEIHAKTSLPIFIAETDLAHLDSTGYQSITGFIRDLCSHGGDGVLQLQDGKAIPLSGTQWTELDNALTTYCGPITPASN
jgi:transcriptional regulator with XRE-family HTH domain